MATKIEGGSGVQVKAEPWVEGKLVVGFLVGKSTPPKCDSLKYTFDLGGGEMVACWGTGALDSQGQKMENGLFYRILCLGKSLPLEVTDERTGKPKKIMAWQFEVLKADNQAEQNTWTSEYRAYVAGGGK